MNDLIWGDELAAMRERKHMTEASPIDHSIYGPDYSKPVGQLADHELAEQYKLLARFIETYPTAEELEAIIKRANQDLERLSVEGGGFSAVLEAERKKLPKLREKVQKTQTALAQQMAKIERLEYLAGRARDLRSHAAREKRRAKASLEHGLPKLGKYSKDEWPTVQARRRQRLAEVTKEMKARQTEGEPGYGA